MPGSSGLQQQPGEETGADQRAAWYSSDGYTAVLVLIYKEPRHLVRHDR
jgi:hypothetical protein